MSASTQNRRVSLRTNPDKRNMGWVWVGLGMGVVLAGTYAILASRRVT